MLDPHLGLRSAQTSEIQPAREQEAPGCFYCLHTDGEWFRVGALTHLFCLCVCVRWIWILQDLLGIAFCLNFMKTISLSNFKARV